MTEASNASCRLIRNDVPWHKSKTHHCGLNTNKWMCKYVRLYVSHLARNQIDDVSGTKRSFTIIYWGKATFRSCNLIMKIESCYITMFRCPVYYIRLAIVWKIIRMKFARFRSWDSLITSYTCFPGHVHVSITLF
jgi:hypothetical protein